jgi:hypothetical protein
MWWTERPLKSLTPTKTAICNSMRFAGDFFCHMKSHSHIWSLVIHVITAHCQPGWSFGIWWWALFAFFGDSWFSLSQSNLQNHHMSVSRVNWMKHAKLLNKVDSSPCESFDLFPPESWLKKAWNTGWLEQLILIVIKDLKAEDHIDMKRYKHDLRGQGLTSTEFDTWHSWRNLQRVGQTV